MAFISNLLQTLSFLIAMYKLHQQAQRERWSEDGISIVNAIQGAKTDEERRALARRLSEHISG